MGVLGHQHSNQQAGQHGGNVFRGTKVVQMRGMDQASSQAAWGV